jgi:V/A-type H+/Na+-transporting ATPase subunit D
MPELIKVRPTKIELVKLKRRLFLAQRVQKILKDRLSILTMEFLQTARETVEAKRTLLDKLTELYKALSIAAGYHGYIAMEKELLATEADLKVTAGSRNIAGVRIPSFELTGNGKYMTKYNLVDTSSWLDRAAQLSEECLKPIVELAELQRSFELLAMEINRTKRITNALEYIVIPGLQVTISYLNMKFEERDREEKARLKRVKCWLLEDRQMHKPLQDEVPPMQSGQSSYEKMLQECLKEELRVVNAGLPRSQKRLSNLLNEKYPHVVCNDGSTHLFKRSELEYLAGMVDTAEREALALPMLIELGANEAEATIPILSGYEGKAEEKVISKAIGMPVACEQRRIRIYKPQLALLRSKFKTTTVYVFSPKIVA